ncbi:MAG TPA: hypothetical protein VMM17_05085 [Gemmatimonadaceae bacterium]|nr:hypothetical protein [Gemmatimonadaceae bacterium]
MGHSGGHRAARGSPRGGGAPRLPLTSPPALVGAMRESAGGWWCQRSVSDVLALFTVLDDTYYQAHFEHVCADSADVAYDDVRPAYVLGHLAGMDPDYFGRGWDEVAPGLERSWLRGAQTDWKSVSGFARAAFRRASSLEQVAWRSRLAYSDEAWNAA